MKASLLKISNFLRITDAHDGQLSLTNIALLVVLVKLMLAPALSIVEVGTLFIALASYQTKKIINKVATKEEENPLKPEIDALQAKLDDIDGRVTSLSLNAGIKRQQQ